MTAVAQFTPEAVKQLKKNVTFWLATYNKKQEKVNAAIRRCFGDNESLKTLHKFCLSDLSEREYQYLKGQLADLDKFHYELVTAKHNLSFALWTRTDQSEEFDLYKDYTED